MKKRGGRQITSWIGGTAFAVTDVLTRLEITAIPLPADENETSGWADLLEHGSRIAGTRPENVVSDTGLAYRGVRALNTANGIGSVGPLRKPGGTGSKKRSAYRKERVDEYGFPTCDYCGSPGTRRGSKARGFEIKHDVPYVAYVCSNPHTPECKIKQQWIRCSEESLLLGPISREEAIYFQLRRALREFEKSHDLQRERYENSGQDTKTRARIIGHSWQRLNLATGSFLEIFRLCLRLGLLGNNPKTFKPVLKPMAGGDKGLKGMTRIRRMAGLLLPRGPKARALGLEFEGELPEGWTPIAERRKAKKAKKRAPSKNATNANADAKAKARGTPKPRAPEPSPPPADEPALSAAEALEHSPF